ncbi:MAG: hypothetical protein RLZ25_661 [Pseudomonadota bacterium]
MGHRTNAMAELSGRFNRIENTGRIAEPFSKLTTAIRALEELHSARDLTMPAEHHIAKVGRAAQSLASKLDSIKSQALSHYSHESGKLSGMIVDRLNLKPNRFEAELRAALLAMPSLADRISWLQEAAKDPANGPLLAAVIEAPPALTGISTEAMRVVEKDFIQTHAPDLVQIQQDLDDALSITSSAHRTASVMTAEFQNPAELKRISEAEQAAAQAQQRMNEALI